jgi:hypothetical protein
MRPHPKAKGNPYQRKLMIRRVEQGWSAAGYDYLRVIQENGEIAWTSPIWWRTGADE